MIERVFKAVDRNGQECEFELKTPTLAEENEGERQYRIAYSHALAEGVFPREKLREIMREHNMWTENDDKEFKKVVGKIAVSQVELRSAEAEGNNDKCLSAARNIAEGRKRMWELFLVQQTVYMNSAEGVAEMVKTESIMAACTVIKSINKRYWDNYSEYVRERDLNSKSTVYAKVITLQSQILDEARQSLINEYPENKYVKTLEDRMLDREVEEKVLVEVKTRAEAAIKKENEKTKRKVVKRAKKLGTNISQPS